MTRSHSVEQLVKYLETTEDSYTAKEVSAITGIPLRTLHSQFHRQFGVSIARLSRLVRLQRAAYQLAYRPQLSILTIALGAGFESHEGFSRAFKRLGGQMPSEFRTQPNWMNWQHIDELLVASRQLITQDGECINVALQHITALPVAAYTHRGRLSQLPCSLQRFIGWRREHKLPPSRSRTFNVFYCDPNTTFEEEFTLGLWAECHRDVEPNDLGVVSELLPEMDCLVADCEGDDNHMGEVLQGLIQQAVDIFGYTLGEFPPFVERIAMYPDVPASQAQHRVYVPVILPNNEQ